MTPNPDRRIAIALLILRLGLGVFLLVWGLEKFVLPERTVGIFDKFYGLSIGTAIAPVLGAIQCAIALALMAGLFRTVSYGLGLLLHTVSTVSTWRQIIDPWGLISGEVQHLFLAAVPVLAGFAALFLLRNFDLLTIDESLRRK